MTKNEALKLALEALLVVIKKPKGWDQGDDAITAIKEALAQPEQWTPEDMAHRPGGLAQTEPTPEQLAALGWQSIECPFCGTSGAQAFPEPKVDIAEFVAEPRTEEDIKTFGFMGKEQPEEQFCYCDDSISLQIVAGGATAGGLYSRVTLKIDGEYVDYVREQSKPECDWEGIAADQAMTIALMKSEQHEQEPNGYVKTVIEALYENGDPVSVDAAELLQRITAQPTIKQSLTVEPVGFVGARELARIKDFDITLYARDGFDNAVPLYTTPPKRQPLTEQQIAEIYAITGGLDFYLNFARAIEAAHGIKAAA